LAAEATEAEIRYYRTHAELQAKEEEYEEEIREAQETEGELED